jgi:hypothetical protein
VFLLSFKRVITTGMEIFKLKENYSLAIEPVGKRVRLVVYLSGVEKVCRLETRKKLLKFLLSDENHLFKGRLQLAKTAGNITIVVKGVPVGVISGGNLMEIVNHTGSVADNSHINYINH